MMATDNRRPLRRALSRHKITLRGQPTTNGPIPHESMTHRAPITILSQLRPRNQPEITHATRQHWDLDRERWTGFPDIVNGSQPHRSISNIRSTAGEVLANSGPNLERHPLVH